MIRLRPLFLALLAMALAGCARPAPHYDILIKNGSIHDGTGRPSNSTTIAVSGDRIVSMQPPDGASADRVIDAGGLLVMPGFIDPHTHALRDQEPTAPVVNENYLRQGVSTLFIGSDGRGLRDPAATFAALEVVGSGTNIAFLAGHGQIRREVLGMENRAPTGEELSRMQDRLDEQMRFGAYGLSTGLFYAPGSYAETDEVIALSKTAAAHGGIYDTHLRDESTYTVGLIPALDEAIKIARESGIPVHVSHLKALGRDVWGSSTEIIERIETARAAGLEITANQYPWRASGTRFSNALIPRWAMAEGAADLSSGIDDELRKEMLKNLDRRGGPDAMLVTDADSPFRGMHLGEIAAQLNLDPLEAGVKLAIDDDPSIASFVMDPADIAAIAVQPWVMTGSDGSSGHPRLFGTYPKAWRDLVSSGEMSADTFARRSAGLVAETFRICERGTLEEGFFADIVIFDPETFESRANYEEPTLLATGVRTLIINGRIVIDEGELMHLAGRPLRKTAPRCAP